MKIDIEAARALAYETARVCDHENNNTRVLEWTPDLDKEEQKQRKQLSRGLKRLNGMLTPMSKYYCSEMCNRVAYNAIQVLGGSGYMKDYAAERYLARRPHHHHLRGHQPVAGRGRGPRRLVRRLRDLDRGAR